jgi:YHS domain-containing protein
MSDIDQLGSRLQSAFAQAKQRVSGMQQEAGKAYEDLQQRYREFVEFGQWLGANVVAPRVEKLKEFFPGLQERPHRTRHSGNRVLQLPRGPESLASVSLKLSLSHDPEIIHGLLDYDLEILPMFVKYDKHARYEFPVAQADRAAIAQWFDDRLVSFVETVLSLQFSDEYQRGNMVTDPVAEVRFPQAFAKGSAEHGGTTYYFLSEQSLEDFRKNPGNYLGS